MNTENLLGKIFGKLTVIERLDDYVSPQGFSYAKWRCECSCGRIKDILACHIKSGKIVSCGCYRIEKVKERQTKDLTGLRFGRLTVIEQTSNHSGIGSGRVRWTCLCSCGNYTIVWAKHLVGGYTVSCGCSSESVIASELKSYYSKYYLVEIEMGKNKSYAESMGYPVCINPRTKYSLPFDIYIPTLKVFIEVQGEQHKILNGFHRQQAKRNGTTPEQEFEDQKYRDKIKKNFAKRNGIYIEIDLRKIKTTEEAIKYIESKLQ